MATTARQTIDVTRLKFYPATPSRWPDVEQLFGERGACGSAFRKAGFKEVLRRSKTRPIMRFEIKRGRGG
jgi:hypothetical protein